MIIRKTKANSAIAFILTMLLFVTQLFSCSKQPECIQDSVPFDNYLEFETSIVFNGNPVEPSETIVLDGKIHTKINIDFISTPETNVGLLIFADGLPIEFIIDGERINNYYFWPSASNSINVTLESQLLPMGLSKVNYVIISDQMNTRQYKTDTEKYYSFALGFYIDNIASCTDSFDDSASVLSYFDKKDEYSINKSDYFDNAVETLQNQSSNSVSSLRQNEKRLFTENIVGENVVVAFTSSEYGLGVKNYVTFDMVTQQKYTDIQNLLIRIDGKKGRYRITLLKNGVPYDAFDGFISLECEISDGETLFIPFNAPKYIGDDSVEVSALVFGFVDDDILVYDSKKLQIYYTDDYVPINSINSTLIISVDYTNCVIDENNCYVANNPIINASIQCRTNEKFYDYGYYLFVLINNSICKFNYFDEETDHVSLLSNGSVDNISINIDVSGFSSGFYIEYAFVPKFNNSIYSPMLIDESVKTYGPDIFVLNHDHVSNQSVVDATSLLLKITDVKINFDSKGSGSYYYLESGDFLDFDVTINNEHSEQNVFGDALFILLINGTVQEYKTVDISKTNNILNMRINADKLQAINDIIVCVIPLGKINNKYLYADGIRAINCDLSYRHFVDIQKDQNRISISYTPAANETVEAYLTIQHGSLFLYDLLKTPRMVCSIRNDATTERFTYTLDSIDSKLEYMSCLIRCSSYKDGVYHFKRFKDVGTAY